MALEHAQFAALGGRPLAALEARDYVRGDEPAPSCVTEDASEDHDRLPRRCRRQPLSAHFANQGRHVILRDQADAETAEAWQHVEPQDGLVSLPRAAAKVELCLEPRSRDLVQ